MIRLRKAYRTIALIMTFLMFISSAGISMDMHFCGGALKSVSFFGKAKTCHELAKSSPVPMMENCPHHKKLMAEKMACKEDRNCCSNKTVFLEPYQDQNIQIAEFVIPGQVKQFLIAWSAIFLLDDVLVEQDVVPYARYKPPLIRKDIPVLNQSFLF